MKLVAPQAIQPADRYRMLYSPDGEPNFAELFQWLNDPLKIEKGALG